jgi:hypothetical protein
MTGDKREVVTNTLLGAASLIVSVLLILILSSESSRYESDATNRAYAYARQAEQQMASDCRTGVPRDRADCVNKAQETTREDQRKELDLAAQWVTAWWTQVTGSAAVVGVILSAFGVFLVWRTFRATREGNEISRQAMMTDNRAWMEIEIQSLGDLRYANDEFRLKVIYRVKNIGKSVALNVSCEAELIRDPLLGENRTIGEIPPKISALYDRLKQHPPKLMAQNIWPGRASEPHEWDTAVQADSVQLRVSENEPTDLYPMCLVVSVRYNTTFDVADEVHQTIQFGYLRKIDERGQPSLVTVGRNSVGADFLRLVHPYENLGIVT